MSKKLLEYFLYFGAFIAMFSVFFIIVSAIVILGDEFETISTFIIIENHLESKNVSLPFPNFDTNHIMNNEPEYYLGLPLGEFHEEVKKRFVYDENYDCKYWSYVWTLYWQENKDKYNWRLKTIDTDNHVFVMFYNETSYCTADQTNLNCVSVN